MKVRSVWAHPKVAWNRSEALPFTLGASHFSDLNTPPNGSLTAMQFMSPREEKASQREERLCGLCHPSPFLCPHPGSNPLRMRVRRHPRTGCESLTSTRSFQTTSQTHEFVTIRGAEITGSHNSLRGQSGARTEIQAGVPEDHDDDPAAHGAAENGGVQQVHDLGCQAQERGMRSRSITPQGKSWEY